MDLLNRFNISILTVFCALAIGGCKKHERLTASTFSFRVSPSVAAVLPGGTVSLAASGGNVNDVQWTVSPATAGAVTPSVGPSVNFTAGSDYSQVTVFATVQDAVAQAQIRINAYMADPLSTTRFDVYTDQGLPTAPYVSDIDHNFDSDGDPVTNFSAVSADAPEGFLFLRSSNAKGTLQNFWGVTLDDNGSNVYADLNAFSAGKIKFFLRLHRTLVGADNLRVIFKDTGGTQAQSNYLSGNWTFSSGSQTDWREVTINISAFWGGSPDLTHIKIPFQIVVTNTANGGPLTFDIDAVRWEQ